MQSMQTKKLPLNPLLEWLPGLWDRVRLEVEVSKWEWGNRDGANRSGQAAGG